MADLTVEIWHDPDVENPCENDGWKLYSFSRKHINFQNPYEILESVDPIIAIEPELQLKLDTGLAFILSYFEHGEAMWMLMGSPQWDALPDKRWDGVHVAGILIWEGPEDDLGPKTIDNRQQDAAAFVESYTQWMSGETYGYTITDSKGEDVDSCGGFIGAGQHLCDYIKDHTPAGSSTKVVGPLKYLIENKLVSA